MINQSPMNETEQQIVAGKPCPRCTGEVITWKNHNRFHYCDKHVGEIIKEMRAQMTAIERGEYRHG